MKKTNKNKIILFIAITLFIANTQNALAIEEKTPEKDKKITFSWFKKKNNQENTNKKKKSKVEEIKLPTISEGKPKIPFEQLNVMTIEECVEYALSHNPNLFASQERINAAKSGINQARSSFAPRLTARVSYNHNDTKSTSIHSTNNALGFNTGISQLIWDFGKTTAKINMAKYDTESAQYDYDYDILNIVYGVKINYYKVLAALAHLDILTIIFYFLYKVDKTRIRAHFGQEDRLRHKSRLHL